MPPLPFRFFFALLPLILPSLQAGPMGLVLPTDNDAIFSDDPSQFYMYTNRNFEGVASKPWSGGAYGFTRNQKRTSSGIVMTRLHEGIDIRAVHRNASGEPLDEVRSIANGTVVYVNDSPGASNYGRYIVVHHDWGYGPFFSLYAHLAGTNVSAGQPIQAGKTIGKLGYTGAGINRERAHVHLELNMILSDHFKRWYDRHFTTKNRHGIFHGFNLVGMDIAGILTAHRANPNLSLPEFLASQTEIHYKVLIPKSEVPPLLRRYPFLARDYDKVAHPTSWEIAFAASGVPLEIRPSDRTLSQPIVTYVKPTTGNHADHTSKRLTGTGDSASLTPSGLRYMQLLSDSF
ncbi:MAG: M23 family metallopeptidase [Verrucomicrobiaceae bacterium]|nr:M23 family metallopeptidase [Verrucomicrobiaceae bacterium]